MNQTNDRPTSNRVECPPSKDPPVRLFILAAMLIGFGIYCFVDAYIRDKYPYKPISEDFSAWCNWALNHYGAFVFTIAGLVPLVWGIAFLRRLLVADEEGIGYEGKQKITWDKVQQLDASRLKAKGILYLYYDDHKLKLDSWKLKNFRNLVAWVENHVPQEKHFLG